MILVTGGAGYIGSHFAKRYAELAGAANVVILDDLSTGHSEALEKIPGAAFVLGNVADKNATQRIFTEYPIDAVVHFAGSCLVGESQSEPLKYFDNNLAATLSLIESMERAGVRKMVFSSTCATYGNPQVLPLSEDHPQAPVNVYGLTKLMIEKTLRVCTELLGWSCVCLRYFNVAGAHESAALGESHQCETHLIPLALQTALGKRDVLAVYGNDYDTPDGTCIRDYIDVNDLVAAHIQALGQLGNLKGLTCLNLGTTHGASVLEVIRMCEKVAGTTLPIEIRDRRPGDPPVLVADAAESSRVLSWRPTRTLEETIRSAWNWERNRKY